MRNDALSVVSKLAASSNNVFTRSQAADSGLAHRTIATLKKAGVLHEPWRGTLIWCDPPGTVSWERMILGATTGREAVASHRSAARLHGVEGFATAPELDISCTNSVNIRLAGVRSFRTETLLPNDITSVNGVRCTSVARTLCDLGAVVNELAVERAFEDAVRRGANPTWIRSTAERCVVRGTRGPRAVLALLDAFESRGVMRDSWFEKLVEACLSHPELNGLELQYRLTAGDGSVVARFDLAVPDAMLGIEAHSRRHHFGAANEASDEHRDNAVGALGWDVMYLGYGDLGRPKELLGNVVARVRARRSQLAPR